MNRNVSAQLILVAEDDAAVRSLITTALEMHDYRFETAATGEAAIMQAASHAPDLVMLDLGLPDRDGVEVIDPAGEAFDALQHQAVATVPDDEAFDETVHEVYQKGYKLGEKVLRPAMVTVTTGGPKRPKEEAPEEE